MPISNGDAMADTTVNALDYTKALEILKNEYPERDGIDVKTLIDSKNNGGLTYNDFLMLPGYIGAFVPCSATTSADNPIRSYALCFAPHVDVTPSSQGHSTIPVHR